MISGSAQMKAEKMAASALMNRLAPISVAEFMLDPNKERRQLWMKSFCVPCVKCGGFAEKGLTGPSQRKLTVTR